MENDPDRDSEFPPELLEIAYRVGDGDAIDWTSTQTGRADLDSSIAQLRSIARISEELRKGDPSVDSFHEAGSWGRLQLVERLQSGTYGEVWRAHDPALQRDVALKLERHPGSWDERWIEEGRRLARVRHPHVIAVHGADRHEGRAGLWMDLVRGHALEEILSGWGPLGADEIVRVGIDLCAAVGAVHAAGLVHGDIKTRNVMRAGRPGHPAGAGRIVLMDFGSAREEESADRSTHTPLYAAPELLADGRPTVASDIHALGVVLYRMATGRFPREADSAEALRELAHHGVDDLRDLRPDFPRELARIIERALDPDPSRRFPTARVMEDALAHVAQLDALPRSARSDRSRWIVALFAVLALGILSGTVPDLVEKWTTPLFRLDSISTSVDARLLESQYGVNTNDSLGRNMALAGDVDGDGLEDFLVSAASSDSVHGEVFLLRGREGGLPAPWMTFRGAQPTDSFGNSLASGDLNGDGYSDIAIGACSTNGVGEASGVVRIWWGGPDLDEIPDLVLHGDSSNQFLGFALDMSGDLDGDGHVDLCVGAPLDEKAGLPTGHAFVYFGGPDVDAVSDLDLTSASSYSQFGVDLATGDFDGDGFDDLIVGANWENTDAPLAGRAYLYLGGTRLDATPDLIMRGPFEKAMLGGVACLGDINDDGFDDWVVSHGHPSRYHTAVLLVHLGAARLDAHPDLELVGPAEDDGFGTCVGPAGDFDGDGYPDFFVGAPSHDLASRNAGAVYLYRGGPDLDAAADFELLGKGTWDLFGTAAFPYSDPHRSGAAGLAVGASWASDRGRRAGRVDWFVFLPRSGK